MAAEHTNILNNYNIITSHADNIIIIILSACDVVSGKKVDYVTLNPLVLGTTSGTGLLLKRYNGI